ncbi:MptD family putative ECF transporter S component [Tissierella pigra]|uniref:MptD family putative ECF transporter S component n=1 Tax=Tissierella pigra TaxID=2607614 RepID=UPI0012B22A0E|nr:MptD family putative ECF transporter S component [Tissierella pigra]MBU5428316.1 MptD family putative ECF transporter S component [Tissierella pigra]
MGELLFNLIGRNKFIAAVFGFSSIMLGYALGEYIPFVYMQDVYIALYKNYRYITYCSAMFRNYEPKFNDYLMYYNSHCFHFRMFMGKKLLHKHFKKAGIV